MSMSMSPLGLSELSHSLPVHVPPPPYFRPIELRPSGVRLKPKVESTTRPGERPRPYLGSYAQKRGLRYEDWVHDKLETHFGSNYLRTPYVHFQEGRAFRTLVPDGVLRHGSSLVVFEVKIQHMPEAWWQLRQLYQKALQHLSSVEWVSVCEVCRAFDPSMPFPEPLKRIETPEEAIRSPEFNVLVWRP